MKQVRNGVKAECISEHTTKSGTSKHETPAEQWNTSGTTKQQNNNKKYYQYGLTIY